MLEMLVVGEKQISKGVSLPPTSALFPPPVTPGDCADKVTCEQPDTGEGRERERERGDSKIEAILIFFHNL